MRPTIVTIAAVLLILAARTGWSAKPDSPVSWRLVREKPALDDATARTRATTYVGAGDAKPVSFEIVRITDRDDLGYPVRDRLAYSFLFRSVGLGRNDRDAPQVDLHVVVDAGTGDLLLAFTPVRSEWVERGQFRPLDDVVKESGWTLLPPVARDLKSSIAGVLRAAFDQYGPAIGDAGQVVIRPRWVEQKFPARMEGEELVSLRAPAHGWIVHSMGSVVGHWSVPPPSRSCVDTTGVPLATLPAFTQAIILIADSSLRIERTALIP